MGAKTEYLTGRRIEPRPITGEETTAEQRRADALGLLSERALAAGFGGRREENGGEAENLLVPWAVSASHIAFGSIRMEPVFKVLGQSAATAAALAIDDEVAVQDVDYAKLRRRLLDDRQILEPPILGIDPDDLGDVIVIDDHQARLAGLWEHSAHIQPFVGRGYHHERNEAKGEKSAEYIAELAEPGRYEVRLAYSAHENRASNVPVTLHAADGKATQIAVDQRRTPPIDGVWLSLGTHAFDDEARIVISNAGTDGYVVIDAVQLVPVK
jgi:hypothetical protein